MAVPLYCDMQYVCYAKVMVKKLTTWSKLSLDWSVWPSVLVLSRERYLNAVNYVNE